MKKIIFVIVLLFIQKNVYSENLFNTSFVILNFSSTVFTLPVINIRPSKTLDLTFSK